MQTHRDGGRAPDSDRGAPERHEEPETGFCRTDPV